MPKPTWRAPRHYDSPGPVPGGVGYVRCWDLDRSEGRGVEQAVEAAVDGGGEQHQQAQVLPHPQPGVQPPRELGVLGASSQLQVGRQVT